MSEIHNPIGHRSAGPAVSTVLPGDAGLPGAAQVAPGAALDMVASDEVSAGSRLREVTRSEDAVPPPTDLARPGETLGPYRIVGEIGRGTMGVVYEAEDQQLSRCVALKVLLPSCPGDDERRRRFLREARAAAAVVHPHVVAVYSAGHERGLDYLAMEYVAGTTLREAIGQRGGPFDVAEAVRIGEAIASGVGRAHQIGIVHRDLKPENVMITDTGNVKVLDFGLAKLVAPPGGRHGGQLVVSHLATSKGRLLGTPLYMSPEQSKGRTVDARSDVFALGVMLYELVTGRRPFGGDTAVELFIAIDRDEPPPPSTVNRRVAPALETVVLRCLRKSPDERFASCREVADALRHASLGCTAEAVAASDAELRLVSVVRVAFPSDAGAAQDRATVTALLAEYGGLAVAMPDGALISAFAQRPTRAGAATDLAVQAARCALGVRDAVPGAAIAIERFGGAGYLEVELRLAASEAWFAASDGERARRELGATLAQIRLRADDIADPAWRRSYLTRNVDNRRARELAQSWGVEDPLAAVLSGA